MENKRHETISFGLFLLFVGTLALLSNMNIISWRDLLDLVLRFWPAFIIVAGIKMVGNAQLGKFFGLAVDVLFFTVVIFGLVYAKDTLLPPVRNNQIQPVGMTREVLFTDYPNATSARYNLSFGAADYDISDDTSSKYIIADGSTKFKLSAAQNVNKELAVTFVNEPLDRFYRFPRLNNLATYQLVLGVTDLPSILDVSAGASQGKVTLDSQNLTELSTKVGAGELTVNLTGPAVAKKISMSVGAGKTTLRLNGNLKVRVTYSLGAGNLHLRSLTTNLDKDFGGIGANGVYETSPTPDVEITVSVGAGAVDITLD